MYLIAKVKTDDEYFDDSGMFIVVKVNRRLLNRLKKEAAAVKRLNAYCVETFDLSAIFVKANESNEDVSRFVEELDGEECLIVPQLPDCLAGAEYTRVEARTRHTTDAEVYWTAYPKYSSAELYTQPVAIKAIAAALK